VFQRIRAIFLFSILVRKPWVIAVVAQPGVEFTPTTVVDCQSDNCTLSAALKQHRSSLIFEAHSTDYQTVKSLLKLLESGFLILKIGPELTFALRRAIFRLVDVEELIIQPARQSNLKKILKQRMQADPRHWKGNQASNVGKFTWEGEYAYSDRVRYYWSDPQVNHSFLLLCENLRSRGIPMPLLLDLMPEHHFSILESQLMNDPCELIIKEVRDVIRRYTHALLRYRKARAATATLT
jgi:D-tagatose-1,6-bisphosphate aldolase subunit GatZ/KbaZ